MLYDYECESCNYVMIDVYQSIKDEALIECPSCGENALQRVMHGGLGHFVKDVKTIGQLADKNWNNMGSYKRSEIESSNLSKKESQEKNKLRKEINSMTPEQKRKYIIKGEK